MIKPALTQEEWAEALAWPHGVQDYLISPGKFLGYGENKPNDLYRMAALCLHNQEFGFTRGNVEMLRDVGESVSALGRPWDVERHEAANHLADLIEALLPPEGKK